MLDMVRSMMSHVDLPMSFWGYAMEMAALTLNRVPTKMVQKTSYEIWTEKRQSMSFLKVWGCEAFVKHVWNMPSLDQNQTIAILWGIRKKLRVTWFYNPAENKRVVARTAVFLERELVSKRNSGKKIDLDEDRAPQDNVEPELKPEQNVQDNVNENTAQETQIVRRSGRTHHEPERYYGFHLIDNGELMLIDHDEPQTYQDAMNSSDSER